MGPRLVFALERGGRRRPSSGVRDAYGIPESNGSETCKVGPDTLPCCEVIVISQQLVEILACPEDKSAVHLAEEALIKELNEKISRGELKTREGELVLMPH